MEWITDPTAWIGLGTLILLELVLGIDNLIFIAILADKLPPEQRDRARIIGLSLALFMRLTLLLAISWMATLTQPLFSIYGFPVSGRQLILFAGGLFLLFKATMELHERLEGAGGGHGGSRPHAVFWQVIVQIVVLDAVFSLDSVITAVGMVDDIAVMMIAVIVAVAVMMISSRPLMNFVTAHPTVVILCLGFLMMIGFSLVIEGFGVHLPKGYLYAAIGFSILIEAFNQIARGNQKRLAASGNLRERTADAILRMLGGRQPEGLGGVQDAAAIAAAANAKVFAPAERKMIRGVLDLADRPVSSVMTPRREVVWLDPSASRDALLERIKTTGHARYPLAEDQLQNVTGVVEAHEAVRDLLEHGRIDVKRAASQPLVVPESASVLSLLEMFRKRKSHFAVVVDEYGTLHGVVTPTDVLEAIAGDLPESGDERAGARHETDGSWLFDGDFDVRQAGRILGFRLADGGEYATVAGYVIHEFGHLPNLGDQFVRNGWRFEVVEAGDRRIDKVRVRKDQADEPHAGQARAEKAKVAIS